MRRALALARRGAGTVVPNPMVGAVLVKDGKQIASGWHQRAGEAHAEVVTLAAAGERARGASLYVTLEPCNHFGKTPPCTDAIIGAGVATVVVCCRDPNPAVAGLGIETLRERGVEVVLGCEETLGKRLLRPWLHRLGGGNEFRAVVLGRSLDGRFYGTVPEWRSALSPAAARRLHGLERFYQHQGQLTLASAESFADPAFLGEAQAVYAFTIPEMLGERGIALDWSWGAHAVPVQMRLDFTVKLGQTVLSAYIAGD